MAATKTKQYPYRWKDGTYHSIPDTQHKQNVAVGQRQPWAPPAGTYDPSLDVQERAARTGYQQGVDDIGKGRERAASDFETNVGDISRQRGEYEQDYQGSLSDILRSRQQGQQDYQTNTQTIGRNYQRLGNTQQQRGRQMGLYGGGAAQQGAQKRAVNQGLEQTALDTSFNRFLEGSQISEQRLNLEGNRALGDEGSFARGLTGLKTQYGRTGEDYTTAEGRAGTSLSDYIQDVSAARQAQFKLKTGQPIPKAKKPKKK